MGDALLRRRRHTARRPDPAPPWPETTDPASPRAFGTRLREARREVGFATANHLAEALQQVGLRVSGATVGRWERGLSLPGEAELDLLRHVLGRDLPPPPDRSGDADGELVEDVVVETAHRVEELRVETEERVAELRRAQAADLAGLRDEHARDVDELRRAHQALVDELLVEASRSAHELRTAQQQLLADARADAGDRVDRVLGELADATERAVRCREEAEAAATEAAAVLADVRDELARARAELDAVRAELAAAVDDLRRDAEAALADRDRHLADLRADVLAEAARARTELGPGHRVLRRAHERPTLVD